MHKPNLIKQIISDADSFKLVSYDILKRVPVIVLDNVVFRESRRFESMKILKNVIGKRWQSSPKRKCF